MSTHEQLQSENKTLHTDLQALTATISAQGARIAHLETMLDVELYKVESYEALVSELSKAFPISRERLNEIMKLSQDELLAKKALSPVTGEGNRNEHR